jgi:cation diffusion facilitator CzcD-associated flavoprotein CzcO
MTDVVVIGTGFSGLCAGIRMKEAGFTDFVLLERGDAIGGTWRDNTYPGCACDVPSHLYSFSFAPNPRWTRAFAPQAEIRAYLERCADRYELRPHVRLGAEVRSARWAGDRWIVETPTDRLEARVLVSAMGGLSNPAWPDIPGIASFSGPSFHSARWRHDVDLRGKRVAVIGTGASAVQFVPEIAPQVAHLTLFQRTPPWVVARPDRAITPLERRLFAMLPFTQDLARWAVYWRLESRALAFAHHPELLRAAEPLARRHLARQVRDPDLRAKLTPDYAMGCKRILLSNDYYPALTRPNVEVVTDPIREIAPHGVRTANSEIPADILIFGTGFAVHALVPPGMIRGRDGADLAEVWDARPEAYKGTAIAGFPNLFWLLGPNTGLGHNSMVYMIEAQVDYLVDALRQLRDRGWRELEVAPEAQAAWNARIRAGLAGAVWESGCRSWYRDDRGRNTVIWPDFTFRFRRATRRFDADAYRVRA